MPLQCTLNPRNALSVGVKDFPGFKPRADIAMDRQIAGHLKKVLSLHQKDGSSVLRIPSALELSYFYNRSILEVLKGLLALEHQHCNYMMKGGLDFEIVLCGPPPKNKRRAR